MRFLRLDLRAFGPFADAPPIDLGGGLRGLHLVHGPNEAGKSSALRAIRCLLFGFPPRTGDDHRHAYKDLRVGASIRDESGADLAFLRRKGDVRTIRTPDDDEVVEDEALARFLGGLDRERFDDLFAMDHGELVAGGRAIVEGRGSLGSILFAAGSGLARVDEVRKALDAEVDDLFKPTGKNPAINAALAELKAARDASERAMLATSDWVELDATLARERARKEAVDAEIRRVGLEKRRLERLRDALPVIARLDLVLVQLAALDAAPVLSEGFADRRREAMAARQSGIKAGLAAEAALEGVARDLDALGPRDLVLDEADAIRRVRDDLGLYRKALEGRPLEASRLARFEADARGLLLELRPDASLDDAGSPRIPAALKERIQGLAQDLARLDAACSTAEGDVARLLEDGPGLALGAPVPDAPRLAEALARAIERAQAEGDLEGQLASGRAELARLERQADVDLHGLPLWSGSLDDLEALAVPSIATLDRFEAETRGADDTLRRLDVDLAKLEAEESALDREIAREQGAGPAPTEEELADRRALRDDDWRRIRRAWLDRGPVEAPALLADDFEAAVRSADDLADRLRREADAVAEQAQRQWRRRELLDEVAGLIDARGRANRDRDAIEKAWLDAWAPLGLVPLPPREMKDWVAIRRAELVRQARILRDRRLELAEKASKLGEIKGDLGRHLARLGEPPADPLESLASLLSRARSGVDRAEIALRLDAARGVLAKAEAGRAVWKSRWASAVEPLGLLDDASPSQALNVIARFDELAGLMREVVDLRDKLDEQSRFEARFEADVRSLADRLDHPLLVEVDGSASPLPPGEGPGVREVASPSAWDKGSREGHSTGDAPHPGPLPEGEGARGAALERSAARERPRNLSVEATAREVAARFERALVVEARREEALKRQRDDRARLEDARGAVDRAEAAISALVSEAGRDSPDGLIEAERASDEIKDLRKSLRSLEDQLATLAGPIGVPKLREEAEGADPGTLEARIAERADQLEPLERERDDLGEEIGRCRQKLDAMDGGPAAAEAQQAVEERVAHLALDVERYARLRLASAVLREAVERYRKEHQGPVLDRAGALFARLTAGSFAGLRADVDEKGLPVLLGVRADGATLLKVEGMSEGTADQLYLALRLASLQTYLDDHEPMPLVVDDILVNFDNARALAALKALADLSGRTQVLFFTHHDHLVDLARSALDEDMLFVHHLAYPPTRMNGHPAGGSAAEAAKPKRKRKATPLAGEA